MSQRRSGKNQMCIPVSQRILRSEANGSSLRPTGNMRALLLGGPKLIQILSERPLIELGQKPLLGGRIDFADFVHQLTFWHGRFTFDSRKKTRPGLSRPSGRESVIQMPELEQANQQDDPIAALHRMSTTAGVGSQDYVAINNLAIAAALLGLGTALAF